MLEKISSLNKKQAGFRRGHSTGDQIAKVTQTVFDALEAQPTQRGVLALLDFTKAYNRVWRDALLHKTTRMNIPTCYIHWVKALIYDRRGVVRWGATQLKSLLFLKGLPLY